MQTSPTTLATVLGVPEPKPGVTVGKLTNDWLAQVACGPEMSWCAGEAGMQDYFIEECCDVCPVSSRCLLEAFSTCDTTLAMGGVRSGQLKSLKKEFSGVTPLLNCYLCDTRFYGIHRWDKACADCKAARETHADTETQIAS